MINYSYLVRHMPEVEEADITVQYYLFSIFASITSVKTPFLVRVIQHRFRWGNKIHCSLLHFHLETLMCVVLQFMYHDGIFFDRLEHLKLCIRFDYWSKLLFRLLHDSPTLRVLNLRVSVSLWLIFFYLKSDLCCGVVLLTLSFVFFFRKRYVSRSMNQLTGTAARSLFLHVCWRALKRSSLRSTEEVKKRETSWVLSSDTLVTWSPPQSRLVPELKLIPFQKVRKGPPNEESLYLILDLFRLVFCFNVQEEQLGGV